LLATPAYASRIAWSRVQVFWGDERCVPPDDPASNFRMTREALLDLVPLTPAQLHRIHGEDDPTRAAADYQLALEATFAGEPRPRLDLALLGIGEDGHTASLFPGLTAVKERSRWVMAEYVPKVAMWRITLTPAALNAAASVLFLVTGAGKAPALHQILEGPRDPEHLPAQVRAPTDGHVTWLVDGAAASALTEVSRSSSPSSSTKANGRP
jgi:6-phosphogluconolactonase